MNGNMETNKKLSVELKSPNGEIFEVIFNTDKYQKLNDLLEINGFKDHKVLNWKLKNVIFIE